MSAEPALDRGLILAAIRAAYGLDLDHIEFIPEGTAHAYKVAGPGGRFFVKLLPDTSYEPAGAGLCARVTAEVPLLRALRQQGILSHVPCPRPTLGGADLAEVGGFPVIVYDWIEASNLGAGWTAALDRLAPLLGRLHAATHRIIGAVPRLPVPPEDFELPFEPQLRDDLHTLSGADALGRPGALALRRLLAPRLDQTLHLLARARGFQAHARRRPHRLVVCHTDAHGGNVMQGAAGELWVIDWETARLAPPEHDLWMLHARLPEVLPGYEAVTGEPANLDPDLLGFYFFRRVLEDLAVDLHAILHEHTRPEQDAATLHIVERYILPALASTEADFTRLVAALDRPANRRPTA